MGAGERASSVNRVFVIVVQNLPNNNNNNKRIRVIRRDRTDVRVRVSYVAYFIRAALSKYQLPAGAEKSIRDDGTRAPSARTVSAHRRRRRLRSPPPAVVHMHRR